ncbi:sigma-70 family RNA polymerase sigma factor [Cohnella sp. REN36]|uniref:sigma-70 family RNA polymerase sigma factor n=1 Tax=Cohnella sp. REN36 TaxID=2887347 RepID=UPI001D1583C9|nr:sigma-70 family RNA polymerase sigma factor [Cohnella sp. REN36]MCC3376752.1 sigma-70 family RNA polymerase sigma factor [Cohnella sp. REN36]
MEDAGKRLVERLRLGETAALAALMDAYGADVYRLVGRVLQGAGSKEDVEECASDVYVGAWRRIAEYDAARGTLRTWLLILAKYRALDARRRLLRERRVHPLDGSPEPQAPEDTERAVLRKAELECLVRAVDDLGALDRTLFYRAYFYYESQEAIARDLGLTRKAVENRLRRLRERLKTRLGTEGEEGRSWP